MGSNIVISWLSLKLYHPGFNFNQVIHMYPYTSTAARSISEAMVYCRVYSMSKHVLTTDHWPLTVLVIIRESCLCDRNNIKSVVGYIPIITLYFTEERKQIYISSMRL